MGGSTFVGGDGGLEDMVVGVHHKLVIDSQRATSGETFVVTH